MKPPNFFIVGAPKCGTTTLWTYLYEHPNCYMTPTKEPNYFTTDLQPFYKIDSRDEYIKLFEGAGESHIAVGEASTAYLLSHEAMKNIYNFDPKAKIIVMLRNPVDLVYSYHLFRVFLGVERVRSFDRVWEIQEDRKNGKNIPPPANPPSCGIIPKSEASAAMWNDCSRFSRAIK